MSQNTKNACPGKKTSIGGQALIEGIMMMGPEKSAVVVRTKDGIKSKVTPLKKSEGFSRSPPICFILISR